MEVWERRNENESKMDAKEMGKKGRVIRRDRKTTESEKGQV